MRAGGLVLLPLCFSAGGLMRMLGSSRSHRIGARGAIRDKKAKDNIWQVSVQKNEGCSKRREQKTTNRAGLSHLCQSPSSGRGRSCHVGVPFVCVKATLSQLQPLGVSTQDHWHQSVLHLSATSVALTQKPVSADGADPPGQRWRSWSRRDVGCKGQHHALPSADTFSKDLARDDVTASWSAKGIPPFRR